MAQHNGLELQKDIRLKGIPETPQGYLHDPGQIKGGKCRLSHDLCGKCPALSLLTMEVYCSLLC